MGESEQEGEQERGRIGERECMSRYESKPRLLVTLLFLGYPPLEHVKFLGFSLESRCR